MLDPRSLIVIAALLATLCLVILVALRRSFPPTIGGLGTWAGAMLAMLVSAVLFGLRGHIPTLLSVVVANGLMLGGLMAMGDGLRRFGGMPLPARAPRLALLLAMLAPLAWFSLVQPDYPARLALATFLYTVLLAHLALLTLRVGGRGFAAWLTATSFVASAIASAVRALTAALAIDLPGELLDPTRVQAFYLGAFNVTLLVSTVGFILMANERLRATLERLAAYDELSGALSRRALLQVAETELERAARSGQPLSLLMLDLDHFKAINDRHGHLVGDRVITDFANRVRGELRRADVFGRYGGEEFVVLLPDTDLDAARAAAERIRTRAAVGEALPAYAVSIGVATAGAGRTLEALLAAADDALYRAKRNGRNRVEAAGDEAIPEESAPAAC